MIIGKLLFLDFKLIPNNWRGFIILEKSLLERLLSPIILIVLLVFANWPGNILLKVPELPALIIKLFLKLNPLRPTP